MERSRNIECSRIELCRNYPDGHTKMIKNRFLTIFSSLAGGLRRKKQSGAKTISIIPIIVMSQGKPIAFAMAPPAEGPLGKQKISTFSKCLIVRKCKDFCICRRFYLSCIEVKVVLPIAYPIQKATSAMAYTLP